MDFLDVHANFEDNEQDAHMGRVFESLVVIKDEKGEVSKKYTLNIQIVKSSIIIRYQRLSKTLSWWI